MLLSAEATLESCKNEDKLVWECIKMLNFKKIFACHPFCIVRDQFNFIINLEKIGSKFKFMRKNTRIFYIFELYTTAGFLIPKKFLGKSLANFLIFQQQVNRFPIHLNYLTTFISSNEPLF